MGSLELAFAAAPRSRPILCYIGHHKCASSWVTAILHHISTQAGLRTLACPRTLEGEFVQELKATRVDLLVWRDCRERRKIVWNTAIKGFHVYRDPRDLIVSAYFSHLYSHPTDFPEIAHFRESLAGRSKEEGLVLEIDWLAEVLRTLEAWDYGNPSILELKFAELVRAPYAG